MGISTHLRFNIAICWLGIAVATAPAQFVTPTIVLDYTYDANNFFGSAGSPQRLALQAAATTLTSRLTDTLTAITPDGGSNTFTPSFANPATGNTQTVTNLSLVQNEIRVYAGGRDLASPTLGIGGPGGSSAGGSLAFVNNVASRGQAGALLATPTDYGPWGGAITFDSVGTNWNFSLTGAVAGQADFLSVAEHELGHLLGIGTANSWYNKITGTTFTGANATAANGGNPSVTTDGGHWATGTNSTNLLGVAQEASMTPSITLGSRKEFTTLDYAGLADIGWQVSPVPEPSTILAISSLGYFALRRWRGKQPADSNEKTFYTSARN